MIDTVKQIKVKHDRTLAISIGKSRYETRWKRKEVEWSYLVSRMGDSIRTPETLAEFKRLSKDKQGQIKDIGGFVGGPLKEGRRKAENVANRTLITLDLDYVKGSAQDIWDSHTMLNDYATVIYSTHQHSPDSPRLRLIIPLSRPALPDEYQAISRKIAQEIGIDMFDDTTYEPVRLMYWPSHPRDIEPVFLFQDGPMLDPDYYLDHYEDWTDVTQWPVSSRQDEAIQKLMKKQEDPLTKKGIIGAFCRAYTIQDAMDKFLPGVYLPTSSENRYTFNGGSTFGGMIVYDDRYTYSHHGTDPTTGQLCNAFDLVRLHKFGHEDDNTKPDTPVAKLPSFTKMSEFASEDDTVKKTIGEERLREALDDFDLDDSGEDDPEEAVELDTEWMEKLEMVKDRYKSTINNVAVILANDPILKGKLKYNAFAGRSIIAGALPWNKDRKERDWTDSDDSGLRHYMEKTYDITGIQKISDGLAVHFTKHSFHPVRDYLETLEWDGIPRLDYLLIDYLGTPDTPYHRATIRIHLAAAVARVMRPGFKYDTMLSLTGAQGIGKSTFIRVLGRNQWFSDSLTTVQGKEAYEQLQGVWLLEIAEMMATKKAEQEAIKLFLSKTEDIYREAYGRRTVRHKRQCVFFATTNDNEFLRDRTGDRRYWPVKCGEQEPKKSIFDDLPEEIDQVWAEALEVYKEMIEKKIIFDLPIEVLQEAAAIKKRHTEVNDNAGMVYEYLQIPISEDWYQLDRFQRRDYINSYSKDSFDAGEVQREKVCVAEVWVECYGGDPKNLTQLKSREINDILRTFDDWEQAAGPMRFGSAYGTQRAYIKRQQI
ncbi:VapE domain-containing protein [Proteiniclasticum sp. C24MP]|uniref:VapE domain-containing protein n=1 Tax=Proteiniclasticum sp. C24MP TaxID=3374101 RepID=UPI003754444C